MPYAFTSNYRAKQASRVHVMENGMLVFSIEKEEEVFFIVLFPFVLFKEYGDLSFSQ